MMRCAHFKILVITGLLLKPSSCFPEPYEPYDLAGHAASLSSACSALRGIALGATCYVYEPHGREKHKRWEDAWAACEDNGGGALAKLVGSDLLGALFKEHGDTAGLRIAARLVDTDPPENVTADNIRWVSSESQAREDGLPQPAGAGTLRVLTDSKRKTTGVLSYEADGQAVLTGEYKDVRNDDGYASLCQTGESSMRGEFYTLLHDGKAIDEGAHAPKLQIPHGQPRQCAMHCLRRDWCLTFALTEDTCRLYDFKLFDLAGGGGAALVDDDASAVYMKMF